MPFYNYHPQSTAKFGYAIDRRKPFDDKTTNGYFVWKDFSVNDSNIGADVSFDIKEIKTRTELYNSMSVDINVEAKFGLTNASASLSWEKEYKYDSTTIVLIVTGRKIYYPETVNGVLEFSQKGKDSWKKAVRNGTIPQFQRSVGTEVVTKMRRGNAISLLYTFNCTNSSTRERIKAKLDAGWSTGSVSMDFQKELSTIDQTLSINIHGFQSGVGGNRIDSRLTDIIKLYPGDIVNIKKIISEILGNVSKEDRDNSPLMEINTKEISDIAEITNSDSYGEFVSAIELNGVIDAACVLLSEEALKNSKKIDDMKYLEESWNKVDFKPDSLQLIQLKIKELQDQKLVIYSAFRKCINAKTEVDCNFVVPKVEVLNYADVVYSPLIIPMVWKYQTTAWQTSGEAGTFRTVLWPNAHIKFLRAIKGVYVVKNNVRVALLNKDLLNKIDLNGGSFWDIWTTFQDSYNEYVWGWFADRVAGRIISIQPEHVAREKDIKYELEIILDDGSSQTVDIGNAAQPPIVPESYYKGIPPEILDEIDKSKGGVIIARGR